MHRRWSILLLCLLIGACCVEPTVYNRVVIDTYATEGPITANTYLSLYDENGMLIAEDDSGNLTDTEYARIDYAEGLLAGTYYVRVTGDSGPYSIRALLEAPEEDYTLWRFAAYNDPDPYEPDDGATANVPSSPVSLNFGIAGRLNRYLALPSASDVDWFVFTLPE